MFKHHFVTLVTFPLCPERYFAITVVSQCSSLLTMCGPLLTKEIHIGKIKHFLKQTKQKIDCTSRNLHMCPFPLHFSPSLAAGRICLIHALEAAPALIIVASHSRAPALVEWHCLANHLHVTCLILPSVHPTSTKLLQLWHSCTKKVLLRQRWNLKLVFPHGCSYFRGKKCPLWRGFTPVVFLSGIWTYKRQPL